jgi:valyl-tRNA synthetase
VDVDLDYSTLGPKYGGQVNEFDSAIADGDFDVDDDELHVAGETLAANEFELEEARTYAGSGEMVETDSAVVVVH